MSSLNAKAREFADSVRRAEYHQAEVAKKERDTELFHVIGAGGTISFVYEQVRNAAENTEDHLLMQRAIRRFYKRIFMTDESSRLEATGEELITELTLSGYLPNDSVPTEKVRSISALAHRYFQAYIALERRGGERQQAWSVDVLSIEIDQLLRGRQSRDAFEQFIFDHFRTTVHESIVAEGKDFEPLLFVAIHRSLLKSNDAIIRWSLLRRYGRSPEQLDDYEQTNEYIDSLLVPKRIKKLSHLISREGAVFRVLASMVLEQDGAINDIDQPQKFLPAFEASVIEAYQKVESRIDRGVIRSIIFLIITKSLIGLAIEVPYDIVAHGHIAWLVLVVNLLVPPLYMLLLRLTLQLPDEANTAALVAKADKILYGEPAKQPAVRKSTQYNVAFNVVYGLIIIGMFSLVTWGLVSIGFMLVHLIIFLVFFSTASFLGFRLSRMIRELEAVESRQTTVAMVRDFIYLPFVVVGRKISESYAKINIVSLVLDMFIELPLKSVLRLVRQWGAFISSKKDEL